jgi:lysophospholipase L1-like esterase
MKSPWGRATFLILFGVFVFSLTGEVYLRQLAPLSWRVRKSTLSLPRNINFLISNLHLRGCDAEVLVHKNSLGFRGPDPELDIRGKRLIFTVGGSTTECFYLAESDTWPDIVRNRWHSQNPRIWLNNAGLDGQSTFGHLLLLEGYLQALKPSVVLYLIGINDINLTEPNEFDRTLIPSKSDLDHRRTAGAWMRRHSIIWNVLGNPVKQVSEWMLKPGHGGVNLKLLPRRPISITERNLILEDQKRRCLAGFESRLVQLLQITRRMGAEPILLTQPAPYGAARDPGSGVDLGSIQVRPGWDGRTAWAVLELYNNSTRQVAQHEHVQLIDLARQMPKDMRYYYDLIHFSKAGARRFADVVEDSLHTYMMNL